MKKAQFWPSEALGTPHSSYIAATYPRGLAANRSLSQPSKSQASWWWSALRAHRSNHAILCSTAGDERGYYTLARPAYAEGDIYLQVLGFALTITVEVDDHWRIVFWARRRSLQGRDGNLRTGPGTGTGCLMPKFQEGKSGNPGGRPKGALNFQSWLGLMPRRLSNSSSIGCARTKNGRGYAPPSW